jgi:hypothetical protein
VRDGIETIKTDTLVLTDEHDDIAPETAEDIADHIPNAEIHCFDVSSDMTFWRQLDEHYTITATTISNGSTAARRKSP